jgi:hypothetical protein
VHCRCQPPSRTCSGPGSSPETGRYANGGDAVHWFGWRRCHYSRPFLKIEFDLDMAESAYIQYQACNYEGSNELSCSSYALAPAKG